MAPCEVMLGRPLRGPVELVLPRPEAERLRPGAPYVDGLRGRLEAVHEKVRDQLKLTGFDMKKRHDRKADSCGFEPRQAVWLYNPRVRRGHSPKLAKHYTGPFRVLCRITDAVYRIQQTPRSKPMTVNRFRLWKVTGNLPDDWWSSSRTDGDDDHSAASSAPDTSPSPPRVPDDGPASPEREPIPGSATVGVFDEDDDLPLVTLINRPAVSTSTDSLAAGAAEAEHFGQDHGICPAPTTRSGRRIRQPLRFRDADAGVSWGRHSKRERLVWRTSAPDGRGEAPSRVGSARGVRAGVTGRHPRRRVGEAESEARDPCRREAL